MFFISLDYEAEKEVQMNKRATKIQEVHEFFRKSCEEADLQLSYEWKSHKIVSPVPRLQPFISVSSGSRRPNNVQCCGAAAATI